MAASIEHTAGCFQNLPPEALKLIAQKKTQISYLRGETVFKQGAFAPHVLYVNEGLVRLYLQTGSKRQVSLRLAKTGDFLVFSSVFGENIYHFSAQALKDSVICMIDKDALRQVLLTYPGFALQITSRNYSYEMRYLELIENISSKQMRGKLASALAYLCNSEFQDESVFDHLTRQDIADFASITMESAIRFLREFEKEGVIGLNGKQVEIRNWDELRRISRVG